MLATLLDQPSWFRYLTRREFSVKNVYFVFSILGIKLVHSNSNVYLLTLQCYLFRMVNLFLFCIIFQKQSFPEIFIWQPPTATLTRGKFKKWKFFQLGLRWCCIRGRLTSQFENSSRTPIMDFAGSQRC